MSCKNINHLKNNSKHINYKHLVISGLCLVTMLFADFSTFAQEHSNSIVFKGKVVASRTSEFLPNAYVYNANSGRGALTDDLGNFQLYVYPGDSLTFSYNAPQWNLDQYRITVKVLEESEDGELEEIIKAGITKNISIQAHVNTHRDFINSKITKTIFNGRELWLKRTELFPNLRFCDSVRPQIEYMDQNTLGFQQIIDRLFDLQTAAAHFNRIPINPGVFPTKTTPESDGRIELLKGKLNFMCPDGEYRKFSWHCRYTPNAGRIHFIADVTLNQCLIGYIGQKIN